MNRAALARYALWTLLALPSIPMAIGLGSGARSAEALLHPTGEFAARFMIIAMAATPLAMLFRAGWTSWLVRNRRYFGVAAFAYAMAHTVLYVVDMGSIQLILDEFWALGIWTGWLAMFVFLPLGLTSNDKSMRLLGRRWKSLQRFVYLAAAATLVHWLFVHNNIGPALVHFVPLALLETYRIWRTLVPRPSTPAT